MREPVFVKPLRLRRDGMTGYPNEPDRHPHPQERGERGND